MLMSVRRVFIKQVGLSTIGCIKNKMTKYILKNVVAFFFLLVSKQLCGQAEIEPWGNFTGIRIDGQLMEFETNISVVQSDWSLINETAKEKQRPKYTREGNTQIVSSNIDSLYFTQKVTDTKKGTADISLQLNANADMSVQGVYYSFILPAEYYADGSIRLDKRKPVKLSSDSVAMNKYL